MGVAAAAHAIDSHNRGGAGSESELATHVKVGGQGMQFESVCRRPSASAVGNSLSARTRPLAALTQKLRKAANAPNQGAAARKNPVSGASDAKPATTTTSRQT